jgi:hypothetical protein
MIDDNFKMGKAVIENRKGKKGIKLIDIPRSSWKVFCTGQ